MAIMNEAPAVATQFGRYVTARTTVRWSMPGWAWGAQQNNVIAADVIDFQPIFLQSSKSFDRIGVFVPSAGPAGALARLGIYNAIIDANGEVDVGTLLLDAGTVLIDTTGAKEITIDQTLVGWYFLAFVIDAGTFLRGPAVADIAGGPVTGGTFGTLGGDPTAAGFLSAIDAGADWTNNGLPDPGNPLDIANATSQKVFLREVL